MFCCVHGSMYYVCKAPRQRDFPRCANTRPALLTLCTLSFTSLTERGPSERNGLGLRFGVEAHGRQGMLLLVLEQ